MKLIPQIKGALSYLTLLISLIYTADALTVTSDQDADTSARKRDFPLYAREQSPSTIAVPPPPIPPNLVPSGQTLRIEKIDISGGTVLSNDQVQAEIVPFLQRDLAAADIEELRYRLTRLYVDQGYINSGAVIDGYDPDSKSLRLHLVEGALTEIRTKTPHGNDDTYVAQRLALASGPPFHVPTLQERFSMLLDDPLIATLHGIVTPGINPSEALLETEVTRKRPYRLGFTYDNHGPVSLGEARRIFNLTVRDLTGYGDTLTGGYIKSTGNDRTHIAFNIPLTAHDTRLHLFFEHGSAVVLEEPINILNIKSDYDAYEIGFTYPWEQSLRRNTVLGLSIGQRKNKTTLMNDVPFTMSPGAIDGQSKITPLRFTQEWTERDIGKVFTIRSVFSSGLSAWDATRIEDGRADSRFFTWVMQTHYAQQLWKKQLQLISRLDGQLSNRPLPAMEQLALGGVASVRGYRENTLVRDQALFASLELRYLFTTEEHYGRLEGALFTDYTQAWNKSVPENADSLHSLGLGLLWSWKERLRTELYWGHRLETPPQETYGSWQDDGIHMILQLTY